MTFTTNDLCPLRLKTCWIDNVRIPWFVRAGDDVVYVRVAPAHTMIQRRQMRIWDFWRTVVIIFQHSLSMFKIAIMPVRVIRTMKKISKLLPKNSPSNVSKRIRLWALEALQLMWISQINIDWKFNYVPTRRSCQMMRQQIGDVVQSHSIASAHRIASVPVRPVPSRPRTVLKIPLMWLESRVYSVRPPVEVKAHNRSSRWKLMNNGWQTNR